jgi:predicted N-acetyltransferase YhbS
LDVRPYHNDFAAIGEFLIDTHEPGDLFANWLQPRWEYMHAHPNIRDVSLDDIGVAEDAGRIVGAVHPEHSPACVYFQLRRGFDPVPLVDYAEKHFGGWSKTLQRRIRGLYVNEFDTALRTVVAERGYQVHDVFVERHARFVIDGPPPPSPLAPGFRLASLEEENDFTKIHRVLWRGFDHEGPPPPEGVADRRAMQKTPGFRKDLTIVAVAPNGDYAAFGGMWYVPENRVAYVEPVATDPDYRRRGLGTAVVVESIRRVADLGARVAWVGSDLDFYKAMGFEVMFQSDLWVKVL